MKQKDIFVKDGVLYLPHARGGFIKWPVEMIESAGFSYWWRNVPDRGVDNLRMMETWRVLANAKTEK